MGAGNSFTLQILLEHLLKSLATSYQEVDASDKKENGESSHVCKVPVVLILVIPFPEQSRSGEFRKNLTFRKDQQSPLKRNEVETHIQETVKKILDETFRQKTPHYYPYSLLSACSHQENSKEKKLR